MEQVKPKVTSKTEDFFIELSSASKKMLIELQMNEIHSVVLHNYEFEHLFLSVITAIFAFFGNMNLKKEIS